MGQYGGIIGGVVGAVVGFFAGGNVYAGWMIGSAIGGAYSASQQVIPGPKIGDIQKQTAQEGGPRPIVFGRSPPMAGNVIADGGPKKVTRRESQGKGGPKVETESVYRTYAVAFCEGPVSAFRQVWRNNTLVYDADNPDMLAENVAFLKYARFFLGDYEQMPSPDLESVLGVGNVTAHRGTAYMVLKDEDVTDLRGMWSQWMVRIDSFAPAPAIGTAIAVSVKESGVGNRYVSSSPNGRNWDLPYIYVAEFGDPLFETGGRLISNGSAVVAWGFASTANRPARSLDGGYTWIETEDPYVMGSVGCVVGSRMIISSHVGPMLKSDDDGETWQAIDAPNHKIVSSVRGSSFVIATSGGICSLSTNGGSSWVDGPNYEFLTGSGYCSGNDEFYAYIGASGMSGNPLLIRSNPFYPIQPISLPSMPGANAITVVTGGGGIVVVGSDAGHIAYDDGTGFQISPYEIPGDRIAFDIAYNGDVFIIAASGVGGSGIIITSPNGRDWTESTLFEPATVMGLAIVNSSGTPVEIESPPLDYVVKTLCNRAGLDDSKIDVTELVNDEVKGFATTNAYPCSSSLNALSEIFHFSPSNQNGRIKFVKRGGNSVAQIFEQDLIDDDQDIETQSKRGDPIGIPRVLHLNYYDINGGLNTDKQSSERPDGTRAEGESSLQTAVVLSANEAATLVAKNHAIMVEAQKGELNIGLPDEWLRLTDSDPIIVSYGGKSVRGVISESLIMDGEQRYKVIRDRQSIYTMEVEGIPAAPITPPPSRIVGATVLEVLDIPIIRDTDDALGVYIAISGILPAWQGAYVEMSIDGGATYLEGQTFRASTAIGVLTTELSDHPQEYPDRTNTCRVSIYGEDRLLESSDLTGMMNRFNLAIVGDEIINFANADEYTQGDWDIGFFLRGRKGTQTQAHSPGTRFVMLSGAVFVPAELIILNREITVRATSLGASIDTATIVNLTFSGNSQREREPAYLSSYRLGSEIVPEWQGVGRLGGGVNIAMGAYFATYRVSATDGTTTTTRDVAAMTASIDGSVFTGPVTISVRQVNSLTGPGPATEVVVE